MDLEKLSQELIKRGFPAKYDPAGWTVVEGPLWFDIHDDGCVIVLGGGWTVQWYHQEDTAGLLERLDSMLRLRSQRQVARLARRAGWSEHPFAASSPVRDKNVSIG